MSNDNDLPSDTVLVGQVGDRIPYSLVNPPRPHVGRDGHGLAVRVHSSTETIPRLEDGDVVPSGDQGLSSGQTTDTSAHNENPGTGCSECNRGSGGSGGGGGGGGGGREGGTGHAYTEKCL